MRNGKGEVEGAGLTASRYDVDGGLEAVGCDTRLSEGGRLQEWSSATSIQAPSSGCVAFCEKVQTSHMI